MDSDKATQDRLDVVFRALSLASLLKRAEIEIAIHNLTDFPVEIDIKEEVYRKQYDTNRLLRDWVIDEKIQPHLTVHEKELLSRELGEWPPQETLQIGWRVESLGMLLWALGALANIPYFDTQFEPDEVLEPIDILTPTIDFVWQATLRPADQLHYARYLAELWQWRAQSYLFEKEGMQPSSDLTLDEIIRMTATQEHKDGALHRLIDEDFAAFDKAYRDLSEDQAALAASIANERYQVMNWLCAYSDWQEA
ncbi:DUF4272 domain-containing protein [Anaerolineales bacterium]